MIIHDGTGIRKSITNILHSHCLIFKLVNSWPLLFISFFSSSPSIFFLFFSFLSRSNSWTLLNSTRIQETSLIIHWPKQFSTIFWKNWPLTRLKVWPIPLPSHQMTSPLCSPLIMVIMSHVNVFVEWAFIFREKRQRMRNTITLYSIVEQDNRIKILCTQHVA